MQIRELSISGAWELTPKQYGDDRGVFLEWYKATEFTAAVGAPVVLAQANCSVSAAGVLRDRAQPLGARALGGQLRQEHRRLPGHDDVDGPVGADTPGRRHRAGDSRESVSRGIQLTMNGLATALRNSG